MITITEKAAEQVKIVSAEDGTDGITLRVSVVSGGCSGNQYSLTLDKKSDGDTEYSSHGVSILVDEHSLDLVKGLELDYVNSLEGSNFVFRNPQATGGCGCGKSFTV